MLQLKIKDINNEDVLVPFGGSFSLEKVIVKESGVAYEVTSVPPEYQDEYGHLEGKVIILNGIYDINDIDEVGEYISTYSDHNNITNGIYIFNDGSYFISVSKEYSLDKTNVIRIKEDSATVKENVLSKLMTIGKVTFDVERINKIRRTKHSYTGDESTPKEFIQFTVEDEDDEVVSFLKNIINESNLTRSYIESILGSSDDSNNLIYGLRTRNTITWLYCKLWAEVLDKDISINLTPRNTGNEDEN